MSNTISQPSNSTPSVSSGIWAGWVHLLSLACALMTSWLIGVGGMLPSFLVWIVQKDKDSVVSQNAAECFNFNLSMLVYAGVGVLFGLLTIGLGFLLVVPLAFVFCVMWLVCSLVAARRGFLGGVYRYPFSIRFLK